MQVGSETSFRFCPIRRASAVFAVEVMQGRNYTNPSKREREGETEGRTEGGRGALSHTLRILTISRTRRGRVRIVVRTHFPRKRYLDIMKDPFTSKIPSPATSLPNDFTTDAPRHS